MRFLFGDYALDLERRELRRGAELVEVEPQVFDLLAYLVANRDRVASKDDLLAAVWHGRIVSESTLTSRITAARHAIGDSGEQQRFIRTVSRRGFRFVGEVREQSAASPVGTPDHKPAQEVSFCRTADGVNLAVAVCGKGLPVVKTANWMNHVEFDWQSPVWSPLLTRLGAQFRLIRYDERGTGLSDWDVAELSFETFVRDLEAVADALDLRRFALFGNAQGAAVAIVYPVRHPERVSRLVLSGGYAQGWRARGNPAEIEGRRALLKLVRVGWGRDNPAFRQVFTSLMIPGATLEQAQWVNDLQRVSTSPSCCRVSPHPLWCSTAAATPPVRSSRGCCWRVESPMPGSLRSKATTTSSYRTSRHGNASPTRYVPFWMRMAVRQPPKPAPALRCCKSQPIPSFAGVGGWSVSSQLRPLPARRKLRYLTRETTILRTELSVRGRHPCAKSAISSAARKSRARPAAAATCSTPIPARCRPRSASPTNRKWSRPSPMRRRRSRPGPRPTRSGARASCSSSSSSRRRSSTASPSCCPPSTARPSPTPKATSSAGSKWSSSRAASLTC